ELTLAQTLAELKSARPKAKGLVVHDQELSETRITTTATTIPSKDKGKGIMIEEPLMMKKKDQVLFDEQEAIRLQAQFDKEERITREKEEANADLIAQWNDIQDKVETDYELAQRLQAEEQEELTIEEKSKLFQQLLEKRRKFFAAKREQRKRVTNHLPKLNKELFDKAMKRVNTFVDMDTELVGGSEVRAKGNDDQEEAEMKKLIKVVPDEEEVAIDAIPLATKPPSIVDWKIVKEGKISLFQIIRANGSSKRYSSMIKMLRDFDREDLETLWKLVKAKHGSTRPEEGYERVLWGDLRTMFEHNIEDTMWRNLLGNKVLIWKLFDSSLYKLSKIYSIGINKVYVFQPPRFEDPDFLDRVYKVEKVLYGLHQAPRAWYETLLTYLLDNGFKRGNIDKTLFTRRDKGDILLVQVYVDDIIFGSTKKSLCIEFEKMMHKKFQMSSMGKLTFFLGLQVKQKEDGIFIIQDKYVTEILKKFGFTDVKTASTPMET
ncbi:putative ribonuclease H-like domain-containing protein, partial [Tanacetum coccineum]